MHRTRYCPPPCSSARPNRHGASLSRGDLPAQRRGLSEKNLRKQQRDGQREEKLQFGAIPRLPSAYFPTTRMENESGSMGARPPRPPPFLDRKSTRLNSSHLGISYAVFCLKKKMTFEAD